MMLTIPLFVAIAIPARANPATWGAWKAQYGKLYSKEEEVLRRANFEATAAQVQKQNAKGDGLLFEVNEFADLTDEEFAATYMHGARPWPLAPKMGAKFHECHGEALPASIDWTQQGAVTPVKNQGGCGGCWAFAGVGALESAYKIAGGPLMNLSEQLYLDCDHDGSSGCSGGVTYTVFNYATEWFTCTEESYPFTGSTGTCNTTAHKCTQGMPPNTTTSYVRVPADDKNALMSAVAQQPVAVSISVEGGVRSYSSGVYNGTCGTSIDHAVLVTGYGTLQGQDYWQIKNSWGPGWGDHGYFKLKRGMPGEGECIILSQSSYPVVPKKKALETSVLV